MPILNAEKRRAYHRTWHRNRRAEWLAAHGPCELCGSSESLQVDHRAPATKVTHRVWSWTAPRREAELAKCRVLCARCHRRRTADQQRRPLEHGTRSGYRKGCKCSECRGAASAYARSLRGALAPRAARPRQAPPMPTPSAMPACPRRGQSGNSP